MKWSQARGTTVTPGSGFPTEQGLSIMVDAGVTRGLNQDSERPTGNTPPGTGAVRTGVNAATTLALTGNSNVSRAITGACQLAVAGPTTLTGVNTDRRGTGIDSAATLTLRAGSITGRATNNGGRNIEGGGTCNLSGALGGTEARQSMAARSARPRTARIRLRCPLLPR